MLGALSYLWADSPQDSTNLSKVGKPRWNNVVDSVAHDLSLGSLVVVAAAVGPYPDRERLRRLLDLAGDDGRRRWEASAGGRAAFQSVVVSLLLRQLLGHITGVEAASLQFESGPHGKPSLPQTSNGPHFNVSHCSSHGLIGLSDRFEIGVDAETIADYKEGVARRILPPEELAELNHFGQSERARLFYRLWVVKEACVKATGAGLSTPLREVAVPLGATEGRWGPVRWKTLDIADGACACVALVSGDTRIDKERVYSVDAIEVLGL